MGLSATPRPRIVYVVNPPVFFVSHRMALAEHAQRAGYSVSVITPVGDGVAAIKAAGFDWHPMRFNAGGMNPFRDFFTLVDLYRIFRRIRPAIVHNVTVKPVLYGTLAARLACVPRVINAISGLGYLFTGGRHLRWLLGVVLYRLLMRHPDMRVIVQNREDLEVFRKNRLAPEASLHLIRGSGVDVSRFVPTARPKGPPVVMQVSRMVGDKGVREFIGAAGIVHDHRPDARFILVGPLYPGNPSALAEEELRQAERDGHVNWLGPREDIAQLLAGASVVCLPSYREGLPKALLEAGACGLPSVTTDTSGCREVVQDSFNGFLVPVADAPALATAVMKLLDNPEDAWAMGARARAQVERCFALNQVIEAQIMLYGEVSS